MSLPNPGMSFTPFDPLPASDLNDIVENVEALSAGTGLADGSVTPVKRSGGFKIGVIPGATLGSTGNKAITGVGFTPKMVIFRTLGINTNTSTNIGYGGTDGTTQYFVCSFVTNVPSAGRYTGTDACIGILSTSSTLALKASHVSFDADGFTINVTTAQNIDVVYEAYA